MTTIEKAYTRRPGGIEFASDPEASLQDPWAHRSENMKCSSCMWYAPKLDLDRLRSGLGRCRRHAPTTNGFPVVFPADWCGDHKLSEGRT